MESVALTIIFDIVKSNSYILSFNGGKDCTVILDLISKCTKLKIPCLYIKQPDTFDEIDKFISDTCESYNILLYTVYNPSIKQGLSQFLKIHKFDFIFVGTRRTDPHGVNMMPIQMTDESWPGILRVHPILDWQLKDIWAHLLKHKVSYCSLYDCGYSSLGHKSKTGKNPKLLKDSKSYFPAHFLVHDEDERRGRK